MTYEDPYDVLKLPKTASFQEVRIKYIELAKKHHPDRLQNQSDEERSKNEAYFKKVTVAYHTIENLEKGGRNCTAEEREGLDWRTIWNRVEKFMKEYMNHANVATYEKTNYTHSCKIPVSLEEIHAGKIKKVELFVHHQEDPVYLKVPCNEFPQYRIHMDSHEYICNMVLQPHPIYTIDSSMQLHTNVQIRPTEYIEGARVALHYLEKDVEVEMQIPPFYDLDKPWIVPSMGLFRKSDLVVHLQLMAPSKEIWTKLSEMERSNIINLLNQTNALYGMDPGLEKPKTI